jgi:hypothetical protein
MICTCFNCEVDKMVGAAECGSYLAMARCTLVVIGVGVWHRADTLVLGAATVTILTAHKLHFV